GARLDQALVEAGVTLSRRKIRRAIDLGGVYVNRKRTRISSRPVSAGDVIDLVYDSASVRAYKEKEYRLEERDVLAEGTNWIVINKPAGLASQPTKSQSVLHVAKCLEELRPNERFFLVHRLDKETSGAIIL